MLISLSVPATSDGERLDAFLRGAELPDLPDLPAVPAVPSGPLSQRRARGLCDVGAVAIDGVVAEATARVHTGQRVSFSAANASLTLQLRIPVVYADDHVLVLQKPAGLAVHKGPLVDHSVSNALAKSFAGAGLAHRLDREASGLLLIGLSREALKSLGAAMERGAIAREYLGITDGVIDADEQTIDIPLRVTDEPRGNFPKTVVDYEGQRSVSHVTVVDRRKDATLVRVRLETGRTHQIRAHLLAIGHPLLGDARYGDVDANERARSTFGIDRTLLHGARLVFPHPATELPVEVEAMHPPDFARLFAALRHRAP